MSSSSFDIDRARRETRGCEQAIHFNNAGSAMTPAPVADYLYAYLRDDEVKGGYETAAARDGELENFYKATARLVNGSPDEVAFIENATRAWDQVFYAFPLSEGDKILTTVSEYGSNLIAYLQRARQCGAEVVIIPNDNYGQIDTNALEAAIDSRTKLISISHVPTGGGLVNPAKEVGRIARAHGIPYLLDACQSAGQIPLDVEELGCDFLSATGRKYLRGPRATGLLWVRREWITKLEPPLLDQFSADLLDAETYVVREDARRFENWERYFAGQAALGVAIDYAMEWGIDAIWERVSALSARLREALSANPEVKLTDEGAVKCGLVTFQHARFKANEIKTKLSARNINVSVSDGPGMRLSYLARGLEAGMVRSSVHYYNTDEEIDRFVAAIREL
jgi:cysteine desulfurase/selenocysteine lyase